MQKIIILKRFELSLQAQHFPVGKAKRLLEEINLVAAEDFTAFQERRKQEIVTYHIAHNPFYKKLVGAEDFTSWEKLPILTKSNLQQALPTRLSKGFSTKTVYLNKTSGSGGNPFLFAIDKFSHALTWIVFQERYQQLGVDLNASYQARFYGIPLETKGYYKERFKDWLGKRYRFPIFDLSEEKLAHFLEIFHKKPFDYINGYTSAIVNFSKYLRKNNVVLKSICPSLKLCIVTSEMLFPEDRKLLELQLGVPVFNEYGASEVGLIALENERQEWVLNTDSLFIEVVDAHGKILPPESEGRILITSLYNKAHPFIRYEIGDLGSIQQTTNPKKQILNKLVGRTSDFAKLPSGKLIPGLTFYYVTKKVMDSQGRLKEFVIKQHSPSHFELIYVSEYVLSPLEQKKVQEAVDRYLEKGLQLTFTQKEALQRTASGKLKQFEGLKR